MRKNKDILVVVCCDDEEKKLKELEIIKARIAIRILEEGYGDKTLEQYIDSMRGKEDDYS